MNKGYKSWKQRVNPFILKNKKLIIGGLMALMVLAYLFYDDDNSSIGAAKLRKRDVKVYKTTEDDDFVYYFAYASDLLLERIRIGCPSAKKVAIAKLPFFKFQFTIYSKVWKGGVADMFESTSDHDTVWGVVYEVSKDDLANLDKQKGVGKADPKYRRINVHVFDKLGANVYEAISYNIVEEKRVRKPDKGSFKVVSPSMQYKNCVVKGAKENGLPSHYVKYLSSIADNKNTFRRKGVGSVCD